MSERCCYCEGPTELGESACRWCAVKRADDLLAQIAAQPDYAKKHVPNLETTIGRCYYCGTERSCERCKPATPRRRRPGLADPESYDDIDRANGIGPGSAKGPKSSPPASPPAAATPSPWCECGFIHCDNPEHAATKGHR
jgi:hypothetical protein